MKINKSMRSYLHPTVMASIGGIITTLGTQLDKPYANYCFVGAAAMAFLGIIIQSPNTPDAKKPKKDSK